MNFYSTTPTLTTLASIRQQNAVDCRPIGTGMHSGNQSRPIASRTSGDTVYLPDGEELYRLKASKGIASPRNRCNSSSIIAKNRTAGLNQSTATSADLTQIRRFVTELQLDRTTVINPCPNVSINPFDSQDDEDCFYSRRCISMPESSASAMHRTKHKERGSRLLHRLATGALAACSSNHNYSSYGAPNSDSPIDQYYPTVPGSSGMGAPETNPDALIHNGNSANDNRNSTMGSECQVDVSSSSWQRPTAGNIADTNRLPRATTFQSCTINATPAELCSLGAT